MPFSRTTPIRLQPYFGYRSGSRLRISARALRSGKARFASGGRWQAMRTMIAQFASREVADLPVRLEIAREGQPHLHHEAATDDEGFVHFDVPIDDWAMPVSPEWEVVALHWTDDGVHHSVEGHVLVPGDTTPLAVISDIDDTIIETGITGDIRAVLRNWKRVLAQMPDERIAVPGVDGFYGALGGALPNDSASDDVGKHMPAAMDRPFFYVSSSPWNLYSYLVAYMRLK
ncbi:MAG: phosphatase domain-containing protein, partial [Pontixanthobacter sp.]